MLTATTDIFGFLADGIFSIRGSGSAAALSYRGNRGNAYRYIAHLGGTTGTVHFCGRQKK